MTKYRKRNGHRWLFCVLVLFAFCGVFLLFLSAASPNDDYAVAENGRISQKIQVKGLFLYDETVVTSPETGTFYGGFASGDGVAAGEVCGELHRLNDLFAEPVIMISSPVSGIVSFAPDGWEDILTVEQLGHLDLPALFEGYEAPATSVSSFLYRGDPCFKVMDNKKDLHLLVDLGTTPPEGETLRFGFGGNELKGKLISIYRYGDRCFALTQVTPTAECYHARFADLEWILSEREGVLVDVAAITKRFGEVGVYRAAKGSLDFCPVTVVCSDGAKALIEGISAGDCLLLGKS